MLRPGLRRHLGAAERKRPPEPPWWSPAGAAGTGPDVPGTRREAGPDHGPDHDPDATVAVPLVELEDADTGPLPLPPRSAAHAAARVPRAPRPGALPPLRALAGAAVAVAGVLLGIGTLLWATDAPGDDPALRPPAPAERAGATDGAAGDATGSVDGGSDEPAVALPAQPSPVPAPPAPPVAAASPPAPAAPPRAAPVPARPAVDRVPVLVLNNSRVDGLAARAAAAFERGGWPVRDTGSLRGRIRATTIYYPPGQEAVAREFARRFEGIDRVLPRLEGLPGDGLTVVVTRDFRA